MKQKNLTLHNLAKGSSVLLDTNILIDTSKHETVFGELFIELNRLHVVPIIERTIRFEFLRGFGDQQKGIDFLDEFVPDATILTPDKTIFQIALDISHIYLRSDNKHTSVPDALIAAQLCKYTHGAKAKYPVYLATQNHKDFPPVLFERVEECLLTLPDGKIKVVGFYRFKKEIFDDLTK